MLEMLDLDIPVSLVRQPAVVNIDVPVTIKRKTSSFTFTNVITI